MKLLVKQKNYFTHVKHVDTLQGAMLWWALRKNKNCRSFCPTCPWFFRCQEDVAIENIENRRRK